MFEVKKKNSDGFLMFYACVTYVIFHLSIYESRLPEDKWISAEVKLFFPNYKSRLPEHK